MSTLERLLPEALPARWDNIEPPSHGLAVDGTAGLVDFLGRDSGPLGLTFLWPKKPVYDLGIYISDWGGPFPYFMPVWFRVGIDAEILNQPGWARQLPRAFAAISHIVRPFYGDARVDAEPYEGADLDHPHAPGPTSRNYSWYGVPREPPIAMVVGPEYLSHWPEAARDVGADGLAVFNNDLWPAQPLGGCPVPPPSIAERPWELEPLPPHMWPMQLRGQAVGGGLPAPPMKLGPQRPEIWPFGEERHSRGLPASDPTWCPGRERYEAQRGSIAAGRRRVRLAGRRPHASRSGTRRDVPGVVRVWDNDWRQDRPWPFSGPPGGTSGWHAVVVAKDGRGD